MARTYCIGIDFATTDQRAIHRNLIDPCPDHHWHLSKIPDPRRSKSKKELIDLPGE